MKNFIKGWLEKLEDANKQSFGSEPLDCCTIGRDKKGANTTKATNKK